MPISSGMKLMAAAERLTPVGVLLQVHIKSVRAHSVKSLLLNHPSVDGFGYTLGRGTLRG